MMNTNGITPTGYGNMRIDVTSGAGPYKAADGKADKAKEAKGQPASSGPKGAEVILSQEGLIAAARNAEEINTQAVEEARGLLESGQLDTAEAAERAAKAILDLGQ